MVSTWTTGSEAEFRAIWEAAEDGLIINDYDSGTVVEANPAFCRMHGYEPGAMNGLDPTTFIYEGHLGLLAQFQEDVRAGKAFRTRALDVRRDGTLFWVHVSGTQSVFRGKPVLLAVVRDITAEVEAEQILERRVAERTQELSTLLEVTRQVGATLDFEALAPLILDQLRHVIAYSRAALFGLEEDGLVLLQAADGEASPPVCRRAGAHAPTASFGVLWAGISSGETVIVDDLASEPALWEACVRALGDSATGGTLVAAPLTVLGAPAGMLVAFAENPGTFTHRHADLLRAFAGQAAVALGNARMHEQAQSAAVIEERQPLARELHDSVSQALYGIALGSRTARDLLSRNPESAREPMEYVLSLAETGLAEMRALIFALRPESLATEGLVAGIEKHVASTRGRHGIEVVAVLGEEPAIAVQAKEAFYRVVQEGLHNVVKHAGAKHVDVRLEQDAAGVLLEVRDDGRGFDPGGDFPGHLGLKSMHERVTRLGGSFVVESAPGEGTRLVARLPR